MEPRCSICDNPATCYGAYEGQDPHYACDDCCGHGNEDGYCDPTGCPFNYEKYIEREAAKALGSQS